MFSEKTRGYGKMNLAFYSDAKPDQNKSFDIEVVKLMPNKEARWAFIPSQTDSDRKYYRRFIDYYSSLEYRNFEYLDFDLEFEQNNLARLNEFDAVYLSGGNTFYFLSRIKQTGADSALRDFAKLPGKVLVGVSAGAMIMTPTIMNTVIQHQIKGDFEELNKCGLTDYSGLALVNFEFVPHFTVESKGEMIKKYVPQTNNKVYGCPDGSGIIVSGINAHLIGAVTELS